MELQSELMLYPTGGSIKGSETVHCSCTEQGTGPIAPSHPKGPSLGKELLEDA